MIRVMRICAAKALRTLPGKRGLDEKELEKKKKDGYFVPFVNPSGCVHGRMLRLLGVFRKNGGSGRGSDQIEQYHGLFRGI